MDDLDVLIIGAGLAGLSCARALTNSGARVLVVERSSTVGGRCATKAAGEGGGLVDFGPAFVHGDDEEFLEWIEGFGNELVPGWPARVEGSGTPCQPQAFDPLQKRYGLKPGIRRLADELASGLDIVTSTSVESLEWGASTVEVITEGRRLRARHGVVAAAREQTLGLLATLGEGLEATRSASALLSSFSSLPCLAVLAQYPAGTLAPDWDVRYPEDSRALLMVSNEGTKRGFAPGDGPALVFQARPLWSAARLDGDREAWSRELLGEAAALLGPWAGRPLASRPHRWKYGRVGAADHLVRPMVLERPGSTARWGLAGDLFDPDGGLQGAWRSGRRLAARLL